MWLFSGSESVSSMEEEKAILDQELQKLDNEFLSLVAGFGFVQTERLFWFPEEIRRMITW